MFFVILVLFVVFGSLLTIITVQNLDTPVLLAMFSWHTPELPLGLIIVFTFLLGALLLYIVSLVSAWRDGREMKKLRQRIAELEQALAGAVAASLPAGSVAAVPMPGMLGIPTIPPAKPETDTMQPPPPQG